MQSHNRVGTHTVQYQESGSAAATSGPERAETQDGHWSRIDRDRPYHITDACYDRGVGYTIFWLERFVNDGAP